MIPWQPGRNCGERCYIHAALQKNINKSDTHTQPHPGCVGSSDVMLQRSQLSAFGSEKKDADQQKQNSQYLTPVGFTGSLKMTKKFGNHKAIQNYPIDESPGV
jgi:hypothetical protein